MDAAGGLPRGPSATPGSGLVQVWPHSAQLAAAFLAGVATALLTVYMYTARLGGRPAELEGGGAVAYRVDLNTARRAELMQLPGVGAALAQRVDDYRSLHGGFQAVDDLRNVRGVGPTTLERLRPFVQASKPPSGIIPGTRTRTADAPRAPSGKKTDGLQGPVDVNRASLDELQLLPGIGPKMSQRIVDQREKSPFKSVEDLRRVSGIGPKILERLRPHVVVTPVGADATARNDS